MLEEKIKILESIKKLHWDGKKEANIKIDVDKIAEDTKFDKNRIETLISNMKKANPRSFNFYDSEWTIHSTTLEQILDDLKKTKRKRNSGKRVNKYC